MQLTLAQQARLAGAVIVTTPQEVALGIAKKGLEMFRSLNIPILGIIENMSGFTCKHCGKDDGDLQGRRRREACARARVSPSWARSPWIPRSCSAATKASPCSKKTPTSPASQAVLTLANRLDQEVRAAAATANNVEPKSYSLVHVGESQELRIEWTEGQVSVIDAYTLRVNCGCANCVDENTGKPLLDPTRVARRRSA